MNQPVPAVTAQDVERIVARDFRGQDVIEARGALEQYGTQAWHRETVRVRIACLKMADGDLERLRRALAVANTDYRDVLAAAEYPAYMARVSPTEKDSSKHEGVIKDDWSQYRTWFEKT